MFSDTPYILSAADVSVHTFIDIPTHLLTEKTDFIIIDKIK